METTKLTLSQLSEMTTISPLLESLDVWVMVVPDFFGAYITVKQGSKLPY